MGIITRKKSVLDEMAHPTLLPYGPLWVIGSSPELATFSCPWFAIQIGRGGVAHRAWRGIRITWRWRLWSGFTRELATGRPK